MAKVCSILAAASGGEHDNGQSEVFHMFLAICKDHQLVNSNEVVIYSQEWIEMALSFSKKEVQKSVYNKFRVEN